MVLINPCPLRFGSAGFGSIRLTKFITMDTYKIALIALFLACMGYAAYKIQEPVKKQLFNECINDEPSDAVCDSCYFAIYGEYSGF